MNIELEQTILGVIINDNDLIQKYELTSDLFLHTSHQKIFDKIESLNKIEIKGSKSTLGDVFDTILEGREYLQVLLSCALNSFDFKSEVKNLKENKAKFDLGCVSDEIKKLVNNPTKNSTQIKQEIIESLEEVFVDSSNNKSCKIGEAARIAFTKETKNILKINYNSIDEITGGFDYGSFVVLAGRPGAGKSCLALNIAMKVAKESPVLFISLEMSKEQISKRAVANLASIHLSKLRHNNLTSQYEVEAFQKAIKKLDELDIEMKGDGGITLTRLRYDIKRFSQKGKLVVIDYVQLIKHKSKGNTVDRITEITNELKAMAMEFGVVIIGLSQLSRAVESRDDKRPMLSDLRDSGSIEQDADVVMFTFRPEYYLSKEEPRDPSKLSQWQSECQRLKGVAYAIIAKVRDGQTGDAKLHFQGEFQRFTEINH